MSHSKSFRGKHSRAFSYKDNRVNRRTGAASLILNDDREYQADYALREGQFSEAERLLSSLRGERQIKAALKLASLPFYRLDLARRNGQPVTADIASDAECVHADIVEVIRQGRADYIEMSSKANGGDSKQMQHRRGMISEGVVAALIARRYNQDGNAYMLPAALVNGSAVWLGDKKVAINGTIGRTDPSLEGPQSIQIKTSRHFEQKHPYIPTIQMIYLSDLAAGNRPVDSPSALSQLLVDDLDATIVPFYQREVDQADAQLDQLLNPSRATRIHSADV